MTGLVLCGGKSTRMGRDKAMIERNGKTLLRLQIERLEQAGCGEVLISGPRGRHYESEGHRLVEDEVPNAGPLAGMCAGMKPARDPSVMALAVDLPDLTVDFLRSLAEGEWDAVVPASEGRYEPLCAVYRRATCLPIMENRLRNGEFALQGMVEALARNLEVRIVGMDEWRRWGAGMLRNWNEGP